MLPPKSAHLQSWSPHCVWLNASTEQRGLLRAFLCQILCGADAADVVPAQTRSQLRRLIPPGQSCTGSSSYLGMQEQLSLCVHLELIKPLGKEVQAGCTCGFALHEVLWVGRTHKMEEIYHVKQRRRELKKSGTWGARWNSSLSVNRRKIWGLLPIYVSAAETVMLNLLCHLIHLGQWDHALPGILAFRWLENNYSEKLKRKTVLWVPDCRSTASYPLCLDPGWLVYLWKGRIMSKVLQFVVHW